MEDLSLHILDIVENSIRAGAREVEIRVEENMAEDRLEIEIRDDGAGMDQATIKQALDPFFTTQSVRKVGLGLSLFREAARAAGGDLALQSEPGKGTRVKATFQHSHIDRQPLGDIAKSLIILIVANPEIRFQYRHQKDGREYQVDSEELFPGDTGGMKELTAGIRNINKHLKELQSA
ncbi:MAG: ATP-binding protein [Candidatus Neomarinimicrobiota bacterium]